MPGMVADVRVAGKRRIDVEGDGGLDLLAGLERLLGIAEALQLDEKRARLSRLHVEGRDAGGRRPAGVADLVEDRLRSPSLTSTCGASGVKRQSSPAATLASKRTVIVRSRISAAARLRRAASRHSR